MISWFERHHVVSWMITIVIATAIFYVSSLSFEAGGVGSDISSILYHILAFFFFAFFLMICLVKGVNRNLVILGIVLAVLYGVSDEFHQSFVPGRSSALKDVLYDSVGILFAFMVYSISIEYREFRRTARNSLKKP